MPEPLRRRLDDLADLGQVDNERIRSGARYQYTWRLTWLGYEEEVMST